MTRPAPIAPISILRDLVVNLLALGADGLTVLHVKVDQLEDAVLNHIEHVERLAFEHVVGGGIIRIGKRHHLIGQLLILHPAGLQVGEQGFLFVALQIRFVIVHHTRNRVRGIFQHLLGLGF